MARRAKHAWLWALVAAFLMVPSLTPSASAAEGLDLLVSASADRSGSAGLDGQTVSGEIYVHAAVPGDTSRVDFYLDDPDASGAPVRTEALAPWDLGGTAADGTSQAVNTSGWATGPHTLTAVARTPDGSRSVTVSFAVEPLQVSRTLVFSDDFDGTALDTAKWGAYRGDSQWGYRSPGNVLVRDGLLTLRTNRNADGSFTTAGISNAKANVQTYGEWQARVRADKGQGVKPVALLWPDSEVWPPEIDFFEVGKADRSENQVTVHHGTRDAHRMVHARYAADFTQWQTVGVRWLPGAVEFTLNGEVMRTITTGVPSEPMWLALQADVPFTEPWAPDASTPARVDFQVDWVKVYEFPGITR